jgi:hypothetical protein
LELGQIASQSHTDAPGKQTKVVGGNFFFTKKSNFILQLTNILLNWWQN